jgi:hypothetical protein
VVQGKLNFFDNYNAMQETEELEVTRAALRNQNSKAELDRRLDQALEETFPASDSISIFVS